jgi:bile acid:Na+ symporter, BASS family
MSFLAWLPTLLMICLALLMFGLGLSLTVADFARLKSHPKAVLIALVLQIIVLPLVCYALIIAFGIAPIVAVGLMLLAASPGGVSANLFSHLFGGNVAMNISLTAINTVLSIATLPLIANWAIAAFAKTGQVAILFV